MIKPNFQETDTSISYLYHYYPTRYHDHVGFSERIVDFKKNEPSMVAKFSEDMAAAFSDWESDWTIVVVPSRKENEWGEYLLIMAQTIMERVHFSDGRKVIRRSRTQPHLAFQGEYSVDTILESLELEPEADVRGRKIVLLDDVADTGKTLMACEKLLLDAGATGAFKVALAKTKEGALFCAF